MAKSKPHIVDLSTLNPDNLGFDKELLGSYGNGECKRVVCHVKLMCHAGGQVYFTTQDHDEDRYHGSSLWEAVEVYNQIGPRTCPKPSTAKA